MAKFTVDGIEGFADKVLQREAATMQAIPKMLKAGGEVLVKAQQEEIRSTFNSKRASGDLAGSIKCTAVKTTAEGQSVEVFPHGKNRRGERNATVGFVHQYGRSNMPARPWLTSANEKAASDVQSAMREEWEAQQND